MIFLSLLEGCVTAGDKLLVFTQSLFTLDLLERILRQLPLPKSELTGVKRGGNNDTSFEEQNDSTASTCQPDCVSQTNGDSDTMNTPEAPEISMHEPPAVTFPPSEDGLAEVSLDEAHVLSNTVIIPEKVDSGSNIISEENKDLTSQTGNPILEFEGEETLRSLHYRLASRLGSLNQPTVWTKNVHYFRKSGRSLL